MTLGQGSLGYAQRNKAATGPTFAGAENGLSVNGEDKVVLGNDDDDVTEPAVLLSDREIPMAGFQIQLAKNNRNDVALRITAANEASEINNDASLQNQGSISTRRRVIDTLILEDSTQVINVDAINDNFTIFTSEFLPR